MSHSSIDDTNLIRAWQDAGDAVSLFVSLGKHFSEFNRETVDKKMSELFSSKQVEVNIRVRRTYTILLCFALKVCTYYMQIFSMGNSFDTLSLILSVS